jgi:serine/threonine protein kinase
MECAGTRSIADFISGRGRISESLARRIFCQIVSAVAHLSSAGIVHRHIELESFMLTSDLFVKLISFGFASINGCSGRALSASFAYAAPELFRSNGYDEKIDIWSLGVVLYVLVCGTFPFIGENTADSRFNILTSEPSYPDYLSPEVVDLFRGIFQKDPMKRHSIADLKTHGWLQFGNYPSLLKENFRFKPPCGPEIGEGDPSFLLQRITHWRNLRDEFSQTLQFLLTEPKSTTFCGRSRRSSLASNGAQAQTPLKTEAYLHQSSSQSQFDGRAKIRLVGQIMTRRIGS